MKLPRLFSAPLVSIALTALGATGCSSAPTVVDAPYTLTYSESGGFAGLNDDYVIDSSARTITFLRSGESVGSGSLSDAEIAQITAAIVAADLASPADYGGNEGVSDAMYYGLTFATKGHSYATTWSSGAPQEVDAVRILVGDLAAQHVAQPN